MIITPPGIDDSLMQQPTKDNIIRQIIPLIMSGCIMGATYLATAGESFSKLLLISVGIILLIIGIKNIILGLVIAISLMNNAFDLLPTELFPDSFLSKIWDFGFIYLLLVTTTFIPRIFTSKIKDIPLFIKCFYFFLGVLILSFIISMISLPDPFIDTFRAFRAYLGYILIPVLIAIFDKNCSPKLSPIFHKFINLFSYICLFLLALYNLQFFLQLQFFWGYQDEFCSVRGTSYIRSIPIFLVLSYFFFWQFIAQWLSGKSLAFWKIIYIILSCTATLFTFTRGHYVSITLLLLVLPALLIKRRTINPARFILAITLALFIGAGSLTTSIMQPFLERFFSTTTDILGDKNSTSQYRLQLVEDRYKIIQEHGLLLGVGFVHPKYAFYRYGPFKANYSETGIPSIWCADTAWANIIYQTGIIGVGVFLFYVAALLFFITRQLSQYQDQLFFLQLACCFELLRHVLSMFNGAIYTYQTQDVALIFGVSAYLHILHCRNKRLSQ